MCSSRIIRKGGNPHAPYTLGPLREELPELGGDPFRPIALGCPDEEEVEPESELPAAPPPSIPEHEAQRLVREAHAGGVREGKAQAEAELAKVTEALGQALLSIGSLRAQIMHETEEDLLKLAVMIARRVTLREFGCDPGIMAGVVQAAVELASETGEVMVRLNPEEYLVLNECREFEELRREHPSITLKPDPAVGRAGCLVETARGNVDAGVEAQLEVILRRLAEEKSEHREDIDG